MTKNTETKKTAPKKKTVTSAKKKEDALKAELASVKQDRDALQDRYLRTVAELENIRKRQAREMLLTIETANEGLLKDILPVVDDIERSLKIPNDLEHAEAFRQGVEMISQKVESLLKRYGVTPMECVGEAFDVDRHDALMQVEAGENIASDMVVEEHERGYLIGDRVLRHAKVLVSK